jgi:hypothetical protein
MERFMMSMTREQTILLSSLPFIITLRTINTLVSILYLLYCIYRICIEHGVFKILERRFLDPRVPRSAGGEAV